MKKIIAILCAALTLFAACTMTELTEPSAEELKLNLTITRADGLGGDAPDTKAIKTGWAVGDVILVFFKTDVHKYLELKYSGASWVGTCKNGLTEDEIANASSKKLRAIHMPHNQSVRPERGITSYNMLAYYDYFLESGLVDYIYSSTGGLTATLRMAAPQYTGSSSGKLIDFQVTGFDPSRTYHMNMKYLRALFTMGVDHADLNLSYGAYSLDRERLIVGRKDGSAMHFTGLLDQSAVGEPVTFDFTILDQENKIAYTRSVGPKTVNGNLSVNLGDISDESKWKATPYEDMGIDNADGKRIYWSKYNLGASATYPYGYYFSFGQIQGYPIQGTFGNYTCEHKFNDDKLSDSELLARLDSNGNLKPEYDAARAVLGGAWRIPTRDEMLLLYYNTTRSSYMPSGEGQNFGITYTSTKAGYTSRNILLPAAGEVYGQTPYNQRKGLCHLTASTREGDANAYHCYQTTLDYPDRADYLIDGLNYFGAYFRGFPIRPVFTLQ